MPTKRPLFGYVFEVNGDPAVGVLVTFEGYAATYQLDGSIASTPVEPATTTSAGRYDVELVVNAKYLVTIPGESFEIVVPAGDSPVSVESLRGPGGEITTPTVQMAIDNSIAATPLGGLADVDTIGAADGEVLTYLDGLWLPLPGGGGGVTQEQLDAEADARENADTVHAGLTTTAHGGIVASADPRLSDSRTPTGGAGGVLSGNYPNPGFAVNMATQDELDSAVAGEATTRAAVDTILTDALNTEIGARQAGDAQAQTNLTAHTGNTANPHATTAVQVGAPAYTQTYGPLWVAGSWFHTSILFVNTGGMTPVLGTVYFIPTLVPRAATWDRVRFEVATAGATYTVTVGLYARDAATGKPGALLATLGAVVNPAVGYHTLVINQTVAPGWYYAALLVTGTTAPVLRASLTYLSILGGPLLEPYMIYSALTFTGQTAFPTSALAFNGMQSSNAPQIDIRIGSLD